MTSSARFAARGLTSKSNPPDTKHKTCKRVDTRSRPRNLNPRTSTSRCYNRTSSRRNCWPLAEDNTGCCSGTEMCILLTSSSTTQKMHELGVILPSPGHQAFSMEPTVHGSWPNKFLFYVQGEKKTSERSAATSTAEACVDPCGALDHVGLSPYSRNMDSGQQDEVREKHGGHAD